MHRSILGKKFEHLEIDSLKNIWFCELHLKDNYYKVCKNKKNEDT